MSALLHRIESDFFDCMDGRTREAVIQKKGSQINFIALGSEASNIVAPAMPGATLGLVAYMFKELGINLPQAVTYAERISTKLHYRPSFHIDDEHGHHALRNRSGEVEPSSVVALIRKRVKGCGFGDLMFGSAFPGLAENLRDRGWVVPVLGGEHPEKKGIISQKKGYAVHHPTAHHDGEPVFSMNQHEMMILFQQMYLTLVNDHTMVQSQDSFVDDAVGWMNSNFVLIAGKLRNIGPANIHYLRN